MAVVRSDRIGAPTGLNERRVLAWLWSCADDALAGRVVWSVASLPDGHAAGRRLRELLHDSIEVTPLGVEATGPSAKLARQLDAMLTGVPSAGSLGAAARAAYAHGAEAAEAGLGARVRPGDVVILHDCFTVSLATALRDRGAHAIWHLRRRSATRPPCVREAIEFLDRGGGGAVDAVVIDERRAIDGAQLITAFLPAARFLDIREVSQGGDAPRAGRVALAWASLLGDIVEEDRADHVGGTIQVRPVVAAR
jgi:hypothetical protein